jgi:hypothetical protein
MSLPTSGIVRSRALEVVQVCRETKNQATELHADSANDSGTDPIPHATASRTEAPSSGDSTSTEERRARRIAEYEQAGEMARQHASYRFTMFGFFVTIITAHFAAGGWLVFDKYEPLAGAVVSVFGALVTVVAIAVDARTWRLYKASVEYSRQLEDKWPGGGEYDHRGFFNHLETTIGDAGGIRHTHALNALYIAAFLGSVGLIIYALLWAGPRARDSDRRLDERRGNQPAPLHGPGVVLRASPSRPALSATLSSGVELSAAGLSCTPSGAAPPDPAARWQSVCATCADSAELGQTWPIEGDRRLG